MAEPKRMGRPPLTPGQAKTDYIRFRVVPSVRQQLEAAAAASGRTLTEEATHRLEASFAEDRMRAIAREEMDRREVERASRAAAGMLAAIKGMTPLSERVQDFLGPRQPEPPVGQRIQFGAWNICQAGEPCKAYDEAPNVQPSARGYR